MTMTDKDIEEILKKVEGKRFVDMTYEERLVSKRQSCLNEIEIGPVPLCEFTNEIDDEAIAVYGIRKKHNQAEIAEIEKEIGYVSDEKQPRGLCPSK